MVWFSFIPTRMIPSLVRSKTSSLPHSRKGSSPFVSLVDNDNIKAAFDATVISFNKTTEKLLLSGGNKNCSYLKTATKVIKKPSKKQGFLSMKNGSFFIGFMLEDNSYQMMKAFPSRVRCHHDNRYSRC